MLGANSSLIKRVLECYEIPKRQSIKSNGKHIDLIRELKPGERMEIECRVKHP